MYKLILRQLLCVIIGYVCLLTAGQSVGAPAQTEAPLLLRDPSLSQTQIAFSYAGYVWVAGVDGGDPRRLTFGGHEAKPVFSPDGTQVAFVGHYDGPPAVYVVPAAGGEPRRLTYHSADLGMGPIPNVIVWAPDGKSIVFNSRRAAFVAQAATSALTNRLFKVPVEGGFVEPLPLSRAVQAAFSPDGQFLAYVPNVQRHLGWKGYRGGQTTPIWIATLSDSSVGAVIPRNNSNDFNPMWVKDSIYFLSDRNGPVSIFAFDLRSRQLKEVVKGDSDGMEIKSAAASATAIVYERFGSLYLFDLKSGRNRLLNIHPKVSGSEVEAHFRKVEAADIRFTALSPSGSHVALGVRGEILLRSLGGQTRNLTRTVDVVERDPAWSPDDRSIAYFSDESGEYALHVRDKSGTGPVQKINLGNPPSFYYSPVWSPDSRKVGYVDKRLNYWYVDLARPDPVRIDTDLYIDPVHSLQMTWSRDGQWVAYTKQLPNHFHAVFIYSLSQARSYQLTDGMSDALHIAFDRSGKYLYFTASTDVAMSMDWNDMTRYQHPVTRGVYVIALSADGPSPFDSDKFEETTGGPGTAVKVDLQEISHRIWALPIPQRNYYQLAVGKAGILYLLSGPAADPLNSGSVGPPVTVYEFDMRTGATESILNGLDSSPGDQHVPAFRLSFDGSTLLFRIAGRWFQGNAQMSGGASSVMGRARPLGLDDMQVFVDPRAEWAHMYAQVWRDQRDFFYDPGLHGLNIDELKAKYAPFIRNISTRDDLNYLFNEMLSNLAVGHVAAIGGDIPDMKLANVGLLGADYSVDGGRYRFATVYAGDPWSADTQAPLVRPGSEAHPGEYLLAVNNHEIRPNADLYSFFIGTAGKETVLRVGPNADGRNSRNVTVTPIADEAPLRNFAWMESNRRKVDELSGGRVAYVYLPDSEVGGYTNFNRYYFAQTGKEAAVIDSRYNRGGDFADYIIEYLSRPLLNYWHVRDGEDITSPMGGIFGPKAMIINEMSGSGGDDLPWMFRKAGLGPAIGKRTWGGLVGIYTVPDDLLDGGAVWTPNLAFYNRSGAWEIENRGVPPDIEIEDDPKAEREGHDAQLEKAVAVVMETLAKNPPLAAPHHPPFPNHVDMAASK